MLMLVVVSLVLWLRIACLRGRTVERWEDRRGESGVSPPDNPRV